MGANGEKNKMTYLLKWLNDGRRQRFPVKHLEKDFASGERFIDLMVAEGVIDKEARMRLSGALPLEVFGEVCKAMDELGCEYDKKLAGRILNEQRGAASALLMSIKKALVRLTF